MISSGVLAFYLSENEDPVLWRAMAQLTQDERTEFFRRALNYLLVSDEEYMYAEDSPENDSSPPQHLFASKPYAAPPAYRDPGTYRDNGSYGNPQIFANPQPYEEAEFYRESASGTSAEPQNDWFENDPAVDRPGRFETPQGGRHTLTPSSAQSQSQALSDQERLRKMFEPADENREIRKNKPLTHTIVSKAPTRERRPAESIVQPEIKDVSLNDIFSNTAVPSNDNLRGLDFLLKNVIGEETDEAVLEAIRRKKAASGR